jgi:hypothetical protein
MKEQPPVCCPYCTCKDISKIKDSGLIEIGPPEMDEEEEYPLDTWICSECQRRFVILDYGEDE